MTGDFAPDSPLVREVAPSPNFGERRGAPLDMVILHYTGMATAEAAFARLRDAQAQVSCHYFVFEDGRIVQMVAEAGRAWHAGISSWKGETDVNSRSIGIEIANGGHDFGAPPFAEAQIEAVTGLVADICRRHRIPPERVLAHSDVAPGRKADPGERFPWHLLARAGVGHWVEPAPVGGGRFLQEGDRGAPVEALQAMLALYGYAVAPSGRYDPATRAAVEAFQRHFRPARVDGVADASTIGTLHRLLAALPALG